MSGVTRRNSVSDPGILSILMSTWTLFFSNVGGKFHNLRPGEAVENHRQVEEDADTNPSLQAMQQTDNETCEAGDEVTSSILH